MKNLTLKNLRGVSASQLLAEAKAVRERVSDYTDTRRARLVETARGAINGHVAKKVSRS
jgi:hypothetical protein